MHPIFYKRILVMFLIKKMDLLFYIEELRITIRIVVSDISNKTSKDLSRSCAGCANGERGVVKRNFNAV